MKHYSPRTEECYVPWIRRYILFHDKRPPRDMGATEIEQFLTHLAMTERVSASTPHQRQARNWRKWVLIKQNVATVELRPAGFEPATLGLGNRCSIP